jgi:hypothetical protein
MKALVFLLVLAAAPHAMCAELGRLFFTPAERQQLDQTRLRKQVPAPTTTAQTVPPPEAPQVLTYSGIVRRSDGKAVLWLNNQPVEEKEALSSHAVSGRIRNDGSVTVRVPQSGRTVDLKVGQSVELPSGNVAEAGPRTTPKAVRVEPIQKEADKNLAAPAPHEAPAARTENPPAARTETPPAATTAPRAAEPNPPR